MILHRYLRLAVLLLLSSLALHAEPLLRIYIRSGPKTHGPGAHDHPRFLAEWTSLLTERGAAVRGGPTFPTAEELATTDVLILNAGTVQAVGPRAQIVDKLAKVRAAGAPALSVVEGGGAANPDARRSK